MARPKLEKPALKPEINPALDRQIVEAPEIEQPIVAEMSEQEKRLKGNGIAYCPICIRPLQTAQDDTPICPVNNAGCDRNK